MMRRFRIISLLLAAAAGLFFPTPTVAQVPDDAASRRAAIEMMYPVMMKALEARSFGRARNICDQAIIWEPQNPVHHYNLACIEAQAGRLPQALGALELSVALGFDDARHMQADPDLAPLRDHPRFPELVLKIVDPGLSRRAGTSTAAAVESAATPTGGPDVPGAGRLPVGLYLPTGLAGGSQSPETGPWYFAGNGTVYGGPDVGLSPDDLAGHEGPQGKATRVGDDLEVIWSDGRKSAGPIRPEASIGGFRWLGGAFAAVKPIGSAEELAGVYRVVAPKEGPQQLEFRADGTFRWDGVSFDRPPGPTTRAFLTPGGTSSGRWTLEGTSLTLISREGIVLRRLVVPATADDAEGGTRRLWIGRLLLERFR